MKRAAAVALILILSSSAFAAVVFAQKVKRNRVHIYWCVDPMSLPRGFMVALPCKFARKPERSI